MNLIQVAGYDRIVNLDQATEIRHRPEHLTIFVAVDLTPINDIDGEEAETLWKYLTGDPSVFTQKAGPTTVICRRPKGKKK